MSKSAAERVAEDGCSPFHCSIPLSQRSPRLKSCLPSPDNPWGLLYKTCSPPSSDQSSPVSLSSTCQQLHTDPFSRRQVWPDPSDCCPEKVALVLQLSSHISLVSLWCTNTTSFTRTSRALTPLTLYLTTAWPTTLFALLFRPINILIISLNRATTHLHLWLGFI